MVYFKMNFAFTVAGVATGSSQQEEERGSWWQDRDPRCR